MNIVGNAIVANNVANEISPVKANENNKKASKMNSMKSTSKDNRSVPTFCNVLT